MERERPLSGPVRRCRREETYRQTTGVPDRVTVTEYRTDGSLARQWHTQANGSESAWTYEYGPTGLLLRVRIDDGVGPHSLLYEYDRDDKLARVIVQNSEGREHVRETYEYDADGRKTKTLHLDPAFPPNTPFAWYAGGDGGGSDAVRVLDGHGRLVMRTDFLYDAARNVIEEALTRTDDMLPQELVAEASPAQLAAFRALLGVDGRTRQASLRCVRAKNRELRIALRSGERRTKDHGLQRP